MVEILLDSLNRLNQYKIDIDLVRICAAYNELSQNNEDITVSDIAILLGLSKSTLHRKLKIMRMMNVFDFQVSFADNRRIIVKPGTEYHQFIKTIDKYIHEKD